MTRLSAVSQIILAMFAAGFITHTLGIQGSWVNFGPEFDRGFVAGVGSALLVSLLADLGQYWADRRTSGSSSAPE